MKKPIELLLRATERTNVQDPASLDVGKAFIVGKAWDTEAGEYAVAEPSRIVLAGKDMLAHRTFYQRAVQRGELFAENRETAAALGVPFREAPTEEAPAPEAEAPTEEEDEV